MKKTQIGVENESHYNTIKRIMAINNKPNHNRHLVINEALRIAHEFINSLDEDGLQNIANLKKSI